MKIFKATNNLYNLYNLYNLFDHDFNNTNDTITSYFKVDDDVLNIYIPLTYIDKDKLKIFTENNILNIEYEASNELSQYKFSTNSFKHKINIDNKYKQDPVEITYSKGVLLIKFEKSKENKVKYYSVK